MKSYQYMGYRYWYSRQFHKWVIDTGDNYIYCDTRQMVYAEIIDLIEEDN